jgi:hypothetical protein
MKDMTIREVREQLFKAGFKESFVVYILEITIDGNRFMIDLDPVKPNRVTTLRVDRADSIMVTGLIGNFIGGKGPMNRFSFNSPEQLIKKLKAINLSKNLRKR